MIRFENRREAGRRLAERLVGRDDLVGVVVEGLPRGGVLVAVPVAEVLGAPLDVLVVRKVGVPDQPEVAMGAVGEGGVVVADGVERGAVGVAPEEFEAVAARERVELARRVALYRRGAPVDLAGRTALIVDDGVATGSTARAAIAVARARGASRVVLAVPVGASDALALLAREADEVVALESAEGWFSVGAYYDDFTQTTDQEVAAALARPDP
jgi:putative phosphoribosyl transferase